MNNSDWTIVNVTGLHLLRREMTEVRGFLAIFIYKKKAAVCFVGLFGMADFGTLCTKKCPRSAGLRRIRQS